MERPTSAAATSVEAARMVAVAMLGCQRLLAEAGGVTAMVVLAGTLLGGCLQEELLAEP